MSTLKTTNLQNASAASPAIVLAADGSATANLSSVNGGPIAGSRNRIINGDMRIDQRNAGAAVTVNASALFYTVDRWAAGGVTSGGIFTVQRLDGQLPFSPSMLRVNVTSAATPSSIQTYNLQQRIEGLNVSDLAFGTSAARSVTLSFKVKSTLTGTFSGALQNGAQNRSYPFTFSIPAANTATSISVTIPGDTSGTWAADNSTGMIVLFDLGGGSSTRGTAGAWSGSGLFGVTGAVSLISTVSSTLDISEVQLEPGTVATPFERRSYGQGLALCQRYFQKVGTYARQTGGAGSATSVFIGIPTPVTMRATPSFSGSVTQVKRYDGGAVSLAGITYSVSALHDAQVDFSITNISVTDNLTYWASFNPSTLSAEL